MTSWPLGECVIKNQIGVRPRWSSEQEKRAGFSDATSKQFYTYAFLTPDLKIGYPLPLPQPQDFAVSVRPSEFNLATNYPRHTRWGICRDVPKDGIDFALKLLPARWCASPVRARSDKVKWIWKYGTRGWRGGWGTEARGWRAPEAEERV